MNSRTLWIYVGLGLLVFLGMALIGYGVSN